MGRNVVQEHHGLIGQWMMMMGPLMSWSCWVMDDDDGPERSWSGSVISAFAIFALFG